MSLLHSLKTFSFLIKNAFNCNISVSTFSNFAISGLSVILGNFDSAGRFHAYIEDVGKACTVT